MRHVWGYSKTRFELFELQPRSLTALTPAVDIDTHVTPVGTLNRNQWRQLQRLQGILPTWYLRWRYGSDQTYVLLAYLKEKLVHVEWLVPAEKLRSRYPFLSIGSYSLISCLTDEHCRGLGIFSSQMQCAAKAGFVRQQCLVWAASTNHPSIRAIRKAGAAGIGHFVQTKRFWGLLSHVEYEILEQS